MGEVSVYACVYLCVFVCVKVCVCMHLDYAPRCGGSPPMDDVFNGPGSVVCAARHRKCVCVRVCVIMGLP